MTTTRTIPVLIALAAALLLPTAASAKPFEVKGPVVLAGRGFLGGELTMAAPDDSRPVVFAGRGGYIGLLDLGGDLKVRCEGRGKARSRETEQGTVYLCIGRGGRAAAVGSRFKFRAFAGRYVLRAPEGTTGTVNGRFVVCSGDAAAENARLCAPKGGSGGEPRQGEPKQGEGGGQQDLPTPAELAQLLASKQ